MKYIKLFENFNQSDDLEEIKWILIDLDDNPKLINNELGGKVLGYSIPGEYSDSSDLWVSKFETAKKRLYDFGYTLVTDINDAYLMDRILIIDSDYFDENSLEEIAFQYLEKFKNLKLDTTRSYPLFKDNDGKLILTIHEGLKSAVIDKDIWYLVDMIFPFNGEPLVKSFGINKNVETLLLEWLKENYSSYVIDKVTPG